MNTSPTPPTPVDIHSADHYRWGSGCDGWHLLRHGELSIIQERVPPGASEVNHRHARSRQFFYVLSGTASFQLESGIVELLPGQGLHVPPGASHRLFNNADVDLSFLVVSSPPSHGDRELLP